MTQSEHREMWDSGEAVSQEDQTFGLYTREDG